jgi:hypothetical protein
MAVGLMLGFGGVLADGDRGEEGEGEQGNQGLRGHLCELPLRIWVKQQKSWCKTVGVIQVDNPLRK